MPLPNIKSIKTFGRRKSAGNSTDEGSLIAAAPVSTFRVIPRDEANRKSIGGSQTLRLSSNNDYLPARQNSYEEEAKWSNRGSNSTGTSSHSRVFELGSTTRFSSSSTLQSPVEAIKKDSQVSPNRSQSPGYLNLPQEIESNDDFDDLFAGLDKRNSGLYDDILLSKPPAPVVLRSESEPMLGSNSRTSFPARPARTPPPPPPNFGRAGKVESSPYSNVRPTSNDGLMSSPPPVDSPPQDQTPPPPPPHQAKLANGRDRLGPRNRLGLERSTSSESFARSGAKEDMDALMVRESVRAHRASAAPSSMLGGGPMGRGKKVGRESLLPTQNGSASQSSLSSSGNSLKTPSLSSTSGSSLALNESASPQAQLRQDTPTTAEESHGGSSNSTTPRATEALPVQEEEEEEEEESPLFDPSIADALAAMDMHDIEEEQTLVNKKIETQQRVLTAAQFQILKKHEDLDNKRNLGRATDSDDEYEDDEEDEVTRAQKRRLQEHKEAQHKIWRQRMTKAIGDQSSPLPNRASFQRTSQINPPTLMFDNTSLMATISEAGGSGGSDDDEDIPLAVLQAHGFPSKTNPPDPRHSAHSFLGISRPLSSVGSLPRPSSPSGSRSVVGGPRGSLPPFARKLPQDPYLGSSDLLNPANREALGLNGQRPMSVYTPAGAPPPPNIPNGLVGVIAEEERQRNMRRGSPNQSALRQSAYLPPMAPPTTIPGMPMMGLPGMTMGPGTMPMMGPNPAGASPEQQQLNQQMFQLLQQQSVMLQQLMSQGGMPGVQQPAPFANAPTIPQTRPMSIAASSVRPMDSRAMSMVNLAPPPMQPRTMSMINIPQPNMGANFAMEGLVSGATSVRGLGLRDNHYAPSVAPSERSNIGQPSRYKPVQNSNLADGGSTITATSTILPLNAEKKKSFLSAIIHPTQKGRGKENAVEDDEEDWSKFAMKRRGNA